MVRAALLAILIAMFSSPAFAQILEVTTSSATQTSAAQSVPRWAKGMYVYLDRGADPGATAQVRIEILNASVEDDLEWAQSANVDMDTAAYAGYVTHPSLPTAADFSPSGAINASAARVPLPPQKLKVRIVNVNTVSLSYDVYLLWLPN